METTNLPISLFVSPIDSNTKPGEIVFNFWDDIDNLGSLTQWFDLPDDNAYKKVPNLGFKRTGALNAYAGYPCIAVLFFSNRAMEDPFLREHRQMYLDGYAQGEADCRQFFNRMAAYGAQSIADRRTGLLKTFGEYRARYSRRSGFTAEPHLREMGHDAGYMFAIARALVDMDKLIKPGGKARRKKADISQIITGDRAAVIDRVRDAINVAAGDKAEAVADEIRQMQRDGLIIGGSLDKKVKALYDSLKADIANMPAYQHVVDYLEVWRTAD